MRAALNQMLGLIRHQLNQMAGTGSHALAAGHALLLIHHRNAVHHMDGIKPVSYTHLDVYKRQPDKKGQPLLFLQTPVLLR